MSNDANSQGSILPIIPLLGKCRIWSKIDRLTAENTRIRVLSIMSILADLHGSRIEYRIRELSEQYVTLIAYDTNVPYGSWYRLAVSIDIFMRSGTPVFTYRCPLLRGDDSSSEVHSVDNERKSS